MKKKKPSEKVIREIREAMNQIKKGDTLTMKQVFKGNKIPHFVRNDKLVEGF